MSDPSQSAPLREAGPASDAVARRSVADFSNVSYEQALERARALVPRLRERAARSEAARTMPAETIADLNDSGVLRILQPKRWGGMEFDFVSYVDFAYELARGCASTSWNLVNLAIHHWMLAMYDERAQSEVWGADPQAFIAAAVAYPQGHGRRADGGFVISGRWNFASCIDTADWTIVAVTVRDGDAVVDHRLCLLEPAQYEIVDDWRVLGMKATASMSVVVRDVFVPDYRALCAYDVRGGDRFAGARVNPNPLYRIPFSSVGAHGIGGTAAGNAQALLEQTISSIAERSTSYTASRMRDLPLVQLRVSAAGGKIEAALKLLRNDCIEAQAIARSNVMPDAATKLRVKRNMAYAGQLCTEAVDSLHSLIGANGIYERHPFERLFRDAHTLSGHIMLNFDTWGTAWGLAALGGDINNPTL